jgi:ferredoxin
MVYHALAEALGGPVPGIESLLLDAVTAGARVLGSAACQRAVLALAECSVSSIEALRDGYNYLPAPVAQLQAIANPGRQPVALYESLHRQGGLGGQVTWDVERHYRALGLAPVDGELPDHASVELAYLGHLATAEAEARAVCNDRLVARLRAEERTFLRIHAGTWLPDVGVAMAAAGEPFYAIVGRVLSGFLSEELIGRKLNGQTGARHPTLKDPAVCTLCGLCVGSCPPNALRVIESATETALTLDPAHCTGCDRCVRICPEGALLLSLGAANRSGRQIVWQSARVGCPNCGRPTVSQAELDAVFARLQPDPTVQQRLRLCVECKSLSA